MRNREARTEAHTLAGSTALVDLDRASSVAGQLAYAFGMQAIGLNDVTRLEHLATSLRRALERTVLPP